MSSSHGETNLTPRIESVRPPAAISGGELEVLGSGFSQNDGEQALARFGSVAARLVVGGGRRVIVSVPEDVVEGRLIFETSSKLSDPYFCSIGVLIADGLHPVANPVVDKQGNIYTTRSGVRGEKLPASLFKVDLDFNVKPFASGIVNPTSLIFDRQNRLLVSGRHNGTIYSVTPDGQMEVYVEGMGVATGLAIDKEDNLYVGDRTGTIFKVSPDRRIFVFATLEPSISAYHLVMSSDGSLCVTGPTTSSFDCVYRVNPKGEVKVLYRGFGRPQGMVFDSAGNLYIAASHGGRKGVFQLNSEGELQQVVSGPGIVGLAFLPTGEMVLATTNNLYRLDTSGWIEH